MCYYKCGVTNVSCLVSQTSSIRRAFLFSKLRIDMAHFWESVIAVTSCSGCNFTAECTGKGWYVFLEKPASIRILEFGKKGGVFLRHHILNMET